MVKKYTVVFVHGTGVREPAFSTTCALVEAKLKEWKCPADLLPCGWGDIHGSRLSLNGACIPEPPRTRALGLSDEDLCAALWRMLEEDPYFELRVAAASQADGATGVQLGRKPEGLVLLDKLRALVPSTQLQELVGNWAGSQAFDTARASLLADPIIQEPQLINMVAHEQAPMLARSVVALISAQSLEVAAVPLTAGQRILLIDQLADELSPRSRGLVNWTAGFMAGIATKLGGMRLVENRRRAILEASAPASGDILLYQARGEPIRDYIRETIRRAGDRVIVVAHSLGGIACVDVLASQPEPTVRCLITVGSQAAYFHEIGALWGIQPGGTLPAAFPKWLNIYDPWDLLSYRAEGVFPGRVTDHEVRSGLHFPRSHSAYWNNEDVWRVIAEEM